MYYLIYLSSASELLSEEELQQILAKSRKNNEAAGITGMLLYFDGNFIQAIEGDEYAVKSLYDKITLDKRHQGFIKLLEGKIEERSFSEWSMGFKSISIEEVKKYPGFRNFNKAELFSPTQFNSTHPAMELLKSFYKDYRGRL